MGPADVPFFDGTALIDFGFAGFWAEPNQQFDAAGDATLEAPLTPSLVGQQFYLQWYSYDANNGSFRFSNGLGVDVVP